MSAQIFIDKLEASNLLDAEVISKLRRKVSKPGKVPPAKAVADYCTSKGYLTETQASKLLDSVAAGGAVAQPVDAGGASVISAADLVVEDDIVEAPMEEVIDLTAAAPAAAPIEPVAPIHDPFGLPAADPGGPAANADPYGGTTPVGEAEAEPEDPDEKKEFKGKKVVEQSFESRWIILGSFLLVFLLLLGWFMFTILNKGNKDEAFRVAEQKFDEESYPAAVEEFKEFIKNFQGDPKVPYAHVQFRVAEMKIAASGKDMKNTLKVFNENIEKITLVMADQLDDKPFEEETRRMIAYDTVQTAQRAANNAAKVVGVKDKEAALELARKVMRMTTDGKFVPRSEREKPTIASIIEATEATLNNVENSIIQEKDTIAAVESIETNLAAGNTLAAFQDYDQLVTKHPSADADERIVKILTEISAKEQGLVSKLNPQTSQFADVNVVEPAAFEGRVAFPTLTGKTIADLEGEVGAYLVSGAVYGVDVGNGRIKWRHFVGYETEIDPIWLDSPRRVLLCDQQHHRLMLVEPEQGTIVWHKEVGEPFLRPTVSRSKIFVTTESGKVIRVNSDDGLVSAIIQLPQRLNVPVTANASGNVLYQVGQHLNIYVLSVSLSDISCVQAYYSGHRDNAIRVSPPLLQGVLIVPVNTGPNTSELRILTSDGEKPDLRVAGESREVKGTFVKSPVLYGNFMATITSNGELAVYEVDTTKEEFSLETVAAKSLNLPVDQEIFMTASNGKVWVGTKGLTQFDVIRTKQELKDQTVRNSADFFVGEMSIYEELLVHVRRRSGSRMHSITGVDPASLKEVWRLDFAGPLAGPVLAGNESAIAVNSQGDFFAVRPEMANSVANHQFIHRASTSQQNLVFTRSVQFADGSAMFIGPKDRKDSVSYIPSNTTLPVSLAEMDIDGLQITCDPIAFRKGAIIGLSNGEVRLVVPRSTEEDAVFVPQANVGDQFVWQRPCILTPDSFAIATSDGRVFTVKFMPNNGQPYMAQILEGKVGRRIIGPLVRNGNTIFTLGDGPNGNEVIAIDLANLKVKGNFALGGVSTWGPEVAGDVTLVTMADGTLTAFKDDITTPTWQKKLASGRVSGRPLIWNGKIILTMRDGKIAIVDPANPASETRYLDNREPIVSDSTLMGNRIYVSGSDGTISVFDLTKAE